MHSLMLDVNSRSHPELADQVVEEIKRNGCEAFAFCADVSKEVEVNAMVSETVKCYGQIDILVNNAAMIPRKAWYEITEADWDYIIGVKTWLNNKFLLSE